MGQSSKIGLITLTVIILMLGSGILLANEESKKTEPSATKTKSKKTESSATKTETKKTVPSTTKTETKKTEPSVTKTKTETKKTVPSATKTDTKKTIPAKTKTKTKKTVPAKTKTKTKKETQFVDRDGDGIHDGKEHRFRRSKRQRGKSKLQGSGRHTIHRGKANAPKSPSNK